MRADDIFHTFEKMFPIYAAKVVKYERIGSRMIELTFKNEEQPNLYFLYTSDINWNLGTQPYRRKPDPNYDKKKEEK